MSTSRKIAIVVGVLFIIGTVAGVLSVVFTGSILADPDLLTEVAANENQMMIGAAFVLIMGFALSMMAVVIFPILRKHNEVLAVGVVVFRGVLEAVVYIALVMNLLLLITIGREYVKADALDASYYQVFGSVLHGSEYWLNHMLAIVFSLGALMFYYVLYRSKLIPRWLSGWGFVGAILYLAAPLLNPFDPQQPPVLSLGVGWGNLMWPLAVQEMVFALWLIVKGFNPSAIAAEPAAVGG